MMIFARRTVSFKPSPKISAPPRSRTRSKIRRTATAKPWQSFVLLIRGEELDRHEGPGFDVEPLIARARALYRAAFDQEIREGQDPDQYAASEGDKVIWSGVQVRAVLRAQPDGNLVVQWLDGQIPNPDPRPV